MKGPTSPMGPTKETTHFYDLLWLRRERSVAERLKQDTRLTVLGTLVGPESARTLVVGCGSGDDLQLARGSLFAFDISITAVIQASRANPLARLLIADAQDIPFADSAFDLVICSEVLEYLPAPERCVGEIARVLAPGGRCIISVPNWYSWWGLARRVAETLVRRPVTAASQPIDNWFTPFRLRSLLGNSLDVLKTAGIWYAPPLGYGRWHLPDAISAAVLVPFRPIEALLARVAPRWGHMIAVMAVKREPTGCSRPDDEAITTPREAVAATSSPQMPGREPT